MRYIVLAFLAAAAVHGSEAEYLGGSVKTVPTHITGNLDLTDPANLVFIYYKGVYRLPFESIRSFEVTPTKSRLRLPYHRSGVLNLSFRTEDQANQIISFKLIGKDLASIEWALKAHVEEPGAVNIDTSRTRLTEPWWGDRYWRTTRTASSPSLASPTALSTPAPPAAALAASRD